MNDFKQYSDAELIACLKQDRNTCERAFAEVYSRYSQRIYAYCLRIMGEQKDAQDIFQETFLHFYKSISEMRIIDNLAGILMRISRNLCLNYIRDARETKTIEDYDLVTNDKGYEQKELLQLIASALELLDFDSREAFILRQYHGLAYNEIASITGDSVTAIKNRVWRAKEKVKEILAPYLEDLSNNK